MNTQEVAYRFWELVKSQFPDERMKEPTETRHNRYSIYVPNKNRNKRWMQVDWNVNVVNIAMDHFKGDITRDMVEGYGIPYGDFDGSHTRIRINNDDAVFISIFLEEPVDFHHPGFIEFLKVHYRSYLRRVGILFSN
ncbi:hypothetical protein [Bacillus dakarensis]|uniref:hypothetical protein n=1 Tax=Robertmurraya dakarensis TaxID=1926278 RepID=UPI00098203D2|nr:hypothetical protein [Bacillus dakarensis]